MVKTTSREWILFHCALVFILPNDIRQFFRDLYNFVSILARRKCYSMNFCNEADCNPISRCFNYHYNQIILVGIIWSKDDAIVSNKKKFHLLNPFLKYIVSSSLCLIGNIFIPAQLLKYHTCKNKQVSKKKHRPSKNAALGDFGISHQLLHLYCSW